MTVISGVIQDGPMETPRLVIRNARPKDVSTLTSLVGELGFPQSVETVAERLNALSEAGESVLVAQKGQEVVGLVTVHVTPVLHRPTPVGRLTALVVAERSRGQGLGLALVEAAERLLLAKGCALVEVTSNRELSGAHAFYERLGYEVTSLRFRKFLLLGNGGAPEGRG
jgi:ribosomal protein S18 acetylase RimI-like enzyme